MVEKIRKDNTDFGSDTDGLVVPKGTTAQRVTTAGIIRFNTTTNELEFADGSSVKVIVAGAPTVTSVSPTEVIESGTTNFTVTGTNFTSGSSAVLVSSTGVTVTPDSTTRDSETQFTLTVDNTDLVDAQEPYSVKVTNDKGLSASGGSISINASPVFREAAGAFYIGDKGRSSVSIDVGAYDPESAGAIVYDLGSVTLPSGLSFSSSTGLITGSTSAVGTDTTTNLTVQAIDVASNVSTRSFSIVQLAPSTTSFSSPGTLTIERGITTIDALAVGGGGGGPGGGGGGGGVVVATGVSVTPGTPVPVTVGVGGHANRSTEKPYPGGTWGAGIGQASEIGTYVIAIGGGGATNSESDIDADVGRFIVHDPGGTGAPSPLGGHKWDIANGGSGAGVQPAREYTGDGGDPASSPNQRYHLGIREGQALQSPGGSPRVPALPAASKGSTVGFGNPGGFFPGYTPRLNQANVTFYLPSTLGWGGGGGGGAGGTGGTGTTGNEPLGRGGGTSGGTGGSGKAVTMGTVGPTTYAGGGGGGTYNRPGGGGSGGPGGGGSGGANPGGPNGNAGTDGLGGGGGGGLDFGPGNATHRPGGNGVVVVVK